MKHLGNFIQAEFVLPSGRVSRLVSEDPGDLDHPLGEFAYSADAVDAAVRSARAAFPKWSALSMAARYAHIRRFGRLLKKEAEALALIMTRETGKTLAESRLEIDRVAAKIEDALKHEMALVRPQGHTSAPGLFGIYRFRPRGVVAILSPFNVPVHLASSQGTSALLMGNTVVMKPSELTPFTAQALCGIWQKAGLPRGVINMVQGAGEVGKALVEHPGVDGVFFTGSWATGSRIQASLVQQPEKICALEMGGKNAAIILKDAKLESAVDETFTGAYLTAGQRCNATSRILVDAKIAAKFIAAFLKKTESTKIGYGTEAGVFMGPLISQKGIERMNELTGKAEGEGFKTLLKGGPHAAGRRGYYVKPSVRLRDGAPDFDVRESSYTDEEIFGPDAAIYVVKNLEEAIQINNRPKYGLVTSVFTASRKNYEKVLSQAQTGIINWNASTVRSSSRLPFGGLKRSGNNRPAGFFTPYLATVPTSSIEKRS